MDNNEVIMNELHAKVMEGDVAGVREIVDGSPHLANQLYLVFNSVHKAVNEKNVELLKTLIELGADLNIRSDLGSTALSMAASDGSLEIVQVLLEAGADPASDREIISTITNSDHHALEIIKLLEAAGADIHQLFDHAQLNRPVNALSMAVMYGKVDVAEYLLSRGAVMPDGSQPDLSSLDESVDEALDDEVVEFFRQQMGKPLPDALIEIVPTEPSIAIRRIPATGARRHITLFTVGMSRKSMTQQPGEDPDFRFAELFIQLPAGWPLGREALTDPTHGWPITWMRRIAQYPHQAGVSLGGPVTIFAGEDPPQPLAPGLPFTSVLLLAEKDFVNSEGNTIQLYRMMPLYPEERQMEIDHGVAHLMRAFDQASIPFIVDVNRKNVGLLE